MRSRIDDPLGDSLDHDRLGGLVGRDRAARILAQPVWTLGARGRSGPMVVALLVAVLGVVFALAGALTNNYLLLAVGFVVIVGSVFWFVRTRQGSPVVTRN